MKTNLDDVPKEAPVEIKNMIDLDFDPMDDDKPKQRKVYLPKEEPMQVGATHLKHEIEEANVLTSSSVRDDSSRNIDIISDVETLAELKMRDEQNQKEK